jgi:hypothetical protein
MPTRTAAVHLGEAYGLGRMCVRHSSRSLGGIQMTSPLDMPTEKPVPAMLFAVHAQKRGLTTHIFQFNLPFGRLMDEVVMPFEKGDAFFLDGVSVKPTDLERIKIVRQHESFAGKLHDLDRGMTWGSDAAQKRMYGEQYHVRLEAIVRSAGEDVTSQIVQAYKTAVAPRLGDYMPNREAILSAAVTVFTEAIKALSR